MNAIKATLSTSQPVITEEEFNTIFYKISELHELHKSFLEGLKAAVASWEEPLSVGVYFKKMVSDIYCRYLSSVTNYKDLFTFSPLLASIYRQVTTDLVLLLYTFIGRLFKFCRLYRPLQLYTTLPRKL